MRLRAAKQSVLCFPFHSRPHNAPRSVTIRARSGDINQRHPRVHAAQHLCRSHCEAIRHTLGSRLLSFPTTPRPGRRSRRQKPARLPPFRRSSKGLDARSRAPSDRARRSPSDPALPPTPHLCPAGIPANAPWPTIPVAPKISTFISNLVSPCTPTCALHHNSRRPGTLSFRMRHA